MPLVDASLSEARAGHALITADGTSIPYQIIANSASPDANIAFAADLDPLQTQTFRFVSEPANTATDLVIEQSEQWIRVSNGRVGISVRKTLREGEGPVEAIRLGSGKWIGDSRLSGLGVPSEFHAEVMASGPVFAEISCCAKFGAHRWQMRFSLQAADPVIVVDEEFSLGEATAMTINLAKNFLPEHVLYRHGKGAVGTWPPGESRMMPSPCLCWSRGSAGGNACGKASGSDCTGMMIRTCWRLEPARPPSGSIPKSAASVCPIARSLVTQDGQDVIMTLPLEEGRRRWLIGAMDRDASLEVLHGDNLCRAPVPQKHFIRHGDFPLDLVKDCIMDWPGDHDNYPRLFVNKADLPGIRDQICSRPGSPGGVSPGTGVPVYDGRAGPVLSGHGRYRIGSASGRGCGTLAAGRGADVLRSG